jgi:hypothetical protein
MGIPLFGDRKFCNVLHMGEPEIFNDDHNPWYQICVKSELSYKICA